MYYYMFLEEEINKTVLMILTDIMLKNLIPKIGQTAKFINELEKLKIILSSVSVNLLYLFNLISIIKCFFFYLQYSKQFFFLIVSPKLYFDLIKKFS
jgi:hypothetical protein